ncbi:MAG: CotH kinase family protein [Prolixibacteraceae bacterium]|nr:CotH kinase family protein [Prolixibacteraceae bacterium]
MSPFQPYISAFLLISLTLNAFSQNTDASSLPIIKIDTKGQTIIDDPKIDATMHLYSNGDLNDTTFLKCNIGIEIRGQTSRLYNRKKQYSFETRKDDGTNLNISLLGIPEENDWVLAAPYDDKTLIRDVLCFNLFSQMGWYAPRTRFCTLYLNESYQGIYLLTEKIKVDKNRIDLKKGEPNSFIFETSAKDKLQAGDYFFTTSQAKNIQIIKYPKTPSAKDSLRGKQLFDLFEGIIYSNDFPSDSLLKIDSLVNLPAFIDYILLNEAVRNFDAFHASTYWSYQKEGKLTIGPPWDCNISMGNSTNQESWKYTGFQVLLRNYPHRLYMNRFFKHELFNRWANLRDSTLSSNNVINLIDSLTNTIHAEVPYNFTKWDILGKFVWPNHFIGKTYTEEIHYLKNWLINRLNWLDYTFGRTPFFAESVQNISGPEKIIVHCNKSPWKLEQHDGSGNVVLIKEFKWNDSVHVAESISGSEPQKFLIKVENDSAGVNSQLIFTF